MHLNHTYISPPPTRLILKEQTDQKRLYVHIYKLKKKKKGDGSEEHLYKSRDAETYQRRRIDQTHPSWPCRLSLAIDDKSLASQWKQMWIGGIRRGRGAVVTWMFVSLEVETGRNQNSRVRCSIVRCCLGAEV